MWGQLEVFPDDDNLSLPDVISPLTCELRLSRVKRKNLGEFEDFCRQTQRTFDKEYATQRHSRVQIPKSQLCQPLSQIIDEREQKPNHSGRKRSFTDAFDNAVNDEDVQGVKKQMEIEGSNGTVTNDRRPTMSAHMLDLQYETEFTSLMRMKQFHEEDEILKRLVTDYVVPFSRQNATKEKAWTHVVWQGLLEHEDSASTDHVLPVCNIQVISRTERNLNIGIIDRLVAMRRSSDRIRYNKAIHFSSMNVRFLEKLCHGPEPKYIIRAAENTGEGYNRFFKMLSESHDGRKAPCIDVNSAADGLKSRQFVLLPLHFVKPPAEHHANLDALLAQQSYAFLAVLRGEKLETGESKNETMWGFNPSRETKVIKAEDRESAPSVTIPTPCLPTSAPSAQLSAMDVIEQLRTALSIRQSSTPPDNAAEILRMLQNIVRSRKEGGT